MLLLVSRACLASLCIALLSCAQVTTEGRNALSDDMLAPCKEEIRSLGIDELTELGFRVAQLGPLLSQSHTSELIWASGSVTRVKTTVTASAPEFVRSRANPEYAERNPAPQCRDSIRLQGHVDIETVDGRLRERLEPIVLSATSPFELRGTFELPADSLVGTHVPVIRGSCFVSMHVRLLFAGDGSHGAITDRLRRGACGEESGPVVEFAGGHWGERWLH